MNRYGPTYIPGFGAIPPPPTPPMLIPHQISKTAKRYDNAYSSEVIVAAQPAVVSAKPTLYAPVKVTQATQMATSQSVDFSALQSEVEKKLKKLKNEKVSAELAISQGNYGYMLRICCHKCLYI